MVNPYQPPGGGDPRPKSELPHIRDDSNPLRDLGIAALISASIFLLGLLVSLFVRVAIG